MTGDQDSSASIQELSRKAEQLSETILNAQPDLDNKMQLLSQADQKHTADLAGLEATKTQLATSQRSVDSFAAAVYMGGRADGSDAILTAASPSNLQVGKRNILAARNLLWKNGVMIRAEATGGNVPRTVRISADDGRVEVSTGRDAHLLV